MILWLASSGHLRDTFVAVVVVVRSQWNRPNPSPFFIVFLFLLTLLRIVRFGRCQPNRINSIRSHLLQVVRAFPHNANLDSNKTALSITALARIECVRRV